jgi:hypothetical protein
MSSAFAKQPFLGNRFVKLQKIYQRKLNMSFRPNPRQALVMWYLLITHDEPAQSKVPLSTFTSADRKELLNAGLIQLEKRKQAQHIVLTDKAWDWALEHLDAPIAKSQLSAPILAKLLGSLKLYLQSQQIPLVELLALPPQPPITLPSGPVIPTDIPKRILAAYKLESGGQCYVDIRLAALREHLTDLPRTTVDQTLDQMQLDGAITLMRLDDPQSITAADAAAALDVYGDKRHVIYVKE